ncbi:MAG: response regulator, partial [Acidobacteria bacterium]|nr:response regulator [Acidobacteriota bacterium]
RVLLEPYFRVTEFDSGPRFADSIENARFDAVLLDISMPDMDGYDVLKLLQSRPDWLSVPVIAVTAHAMHGDREKAISAGFSDYVVKPFDFDELVKCVFRQLEKSGSDYSFPISCTAEIGNE